MSDTASLVLELPGVVSWARPRTIGGRVRYPERYAQHRFAWALLVKSQVRTAQWDATRISRYAVSAEVYGTGRYDLDRVLTALLDALQAGGALTEDSKVDELRARRGKPRTGERTHVVVGVTEAPPRDVTEALAARTDARTVVVKPTRSTLGLR